MYYCQVAKVRDLIAAVISEIIGRSGRHFSARFLWLHNRQAVRGLWVSLSEDCLTDTLLDAIITQHCNKQLHIHRKSTTWNINKELVLYYFDAAVHVKTSASVEMTQTRHSHSKQLFHGGQISVFLQGGSKSFIRCL